MVIDMAQHFLLSPAMIGKYSNGNVQVIFVGVACVAGAALIALWHLYFAPMIQEVRRKNLREAGRGSILKFGEN
jgi:hypothetical protein